MEADDRIASIEDVAARHLCTGCGVCAFLAPGSIEMVDVAATGRRPRVRREDEFTRDAFRACPGPGVGGLRAQAADQIAELHEAFGPVLEIWVGHAVDRELRAGGASGGIVSALSAFALERDRAAGVLHVAPSASNPLRNESAFSSNRSELARSRGARFAPAGPGEGLREVEAAEGSSVVVGKPCDIAGVRGAIAVRPDLARKVSVQIGLLCSGVPAADATEELINGLGLTRDELDDVHYGRRELVARSNGQEAKVAWSQAWRSMSRHLPWRCRTCPDRTAEFADIAVGDADVLEPSDAGRSLVLVRTENGRRFLERALDAGFVELESIDPERLRRMSQHAISQRGEVFAAGIAARLARVSAPRFEGLPLVRYYWRGLGWRSKFRVVLRMLRHIRRQGVRKREVVSG